ncbi:NUDIX hydrolase [Streptomyces buecherae]|uniref:NUDIX hydrolase n=1 Tax=Streptomyces buecherae TaxID=2763006 RepID=UPI0036692C18
METPARTRVSAYAIATTADQLLLTRLSDASPVFAPGLWHLPGGGIDPGEQPRQALAREVYEETGLELLDAHLVGARSYAAHRLGVHWHLVGLFYVATLAPGPLRITEQDGSTGAVRWLPRSGLTPATLSPAARDGLALLTAPGGPAGPLVPTPGGPAARDAPTPRS